MTTCLNLICKILSSTALPLPFPPRSGFSTISVYFCRWNSWWSFLLLANTFIGAIHQFSIFVVCVKYFKIAFKILNAACMMDLDSSCCRKCFVIRCQERGEEIRTQGCRSAGFIQNSSLAQPNWSTVCRSIPAVLSGTQKANQQEHSCS